MRILLLCIDGKLPNLALMKLSRYHKDLGDEVFLNHCAKPDKVYISMLFSWSRPALEKALMLYPDAEIEIGGTGYDLKKKLPEVVENGKPDYDLFSVQDIYARIRGGIRKKETSLEKARVIVNAGIGFTSRGCIRSTCKFCVVPAKEGRFHQVAEISEILNTRSNTLILLDNNLIADPDCLGKLKEIKERKLVVDISQGIDSRLLTPEIVQALSEVRHLRSLHTAWDHPSSEEQVMRGIRMLKRKFSAKKLMAFILCGFDTTPEEDMYRFRKLVEEKVDPYVMVYNNRRDDSRLRHFARWVNTRIAKICAFEDYEPYAREHGVMQLAI